MRRYYPDDDMKRLLHAFRLHLVPIDSVFVVAIQVPMTAMAACIRGVNIKHYEIGRIKRISMASRAMG